MRTSSNILKSLNSTSRTGAGQVVAYNSKIKPLRFLIYLGPDLTRKWISRVQAKVKDTNSQDAFYKLSSLIDHYNKPAQSFKEV